MRNHLDLFISLLLILTMWLDKVACENPSGTESHLSTEAPAITKDISSVLRKFVNAKTKQSFLYFAYGSNVSSKRIQINNPSAKYITTAVLEGFRLDFHCYSKRWRASPATIIRTNKASHKVFGVLWKIDLEHLKSLDEQEEVQMKVYHRFRVPVKPCTVRLEDAMEFQDTSCYGPKQVTAFTYQLTPQRLKECHASESDKPSLAYKNVILKGAREHKLPKTYIDDLENIADNGDGDQVDLK